MKSPRSTNPPSFSLQSTSIGNRDASLPNQPHQPIPRLLELSDHFVYSEHLSMRHSTLEARSSHGWQPIVGDLPPALPSSTTRFVCTEGLWIYAMPQRICTSIRDHRGAHVPAWRRARTRGDVYFVKRLVGICVWVKASNGVIPLCCESTLGRRECKETTTAVGVSMFIPQLHARCFMYNGWTVAGYR